MQVCIKWTENVSRQESGHDPLVQDVFIIVHGFTIHSVVKGHAMITIVQLNLSNFTVVFGWCRWKSTTFVTHKTVTVSDACHCPWQYKHPKNTFYIWDTKNLSNAHAYILMCIVTNRSFSVFQYLHFNSTLGLREENWMVLYLIGWPQHWMTQKRIELSQLFCNFLCLFWRENSTISVSCRHRVLSYTLLYHLA